MALEEFKKLTTGGGGENAPCLREGAVLSTCNRFEVYAITADTEDKFERLEEFLVNLQATPMDQIRSHFYYMKDGEALAHLMKVAAGVDSMVVGEPQILGQVNEAFRDAQAAKTLGTMLTQVFNRAIRVGKRARTETSIGRYTTSVSHAAVQRAEDKIGDLIGPGGKILIASSKHELGQLNSVFLGDGITHPLDKCHIRTRFQDGRGRLVPIARPQYGENDHGRRLKAYRRGDHDAAFAGMPSDCTLPTDLVHDAIGKVVRELRPACVVGENVLAGFHHRQLLLADRATQTVGVELEPQRPGQFAVKIRVEKVFRFRAVHSILLTHRTNHPSTAPPASLQQIPR